MLVNRRSKRTPTGAYRSSLRRRDRRLYELASPATETTILQSNAKDAAEKRKVVRAKGANKKVKAYEVKKVNLHMKDKNVIAEVVSVFDNKANKEYNRRNVITKGAKIKVKVDGKEYEALVTSRPGQSGVVSAKLN